LLRGLHLQLRRARASLRFPGLVTRKIGSVFSAAGAPCSTDRAEVRSKGAPHPSSGPLFGWSGIFWAGTEENRALVAPGSRGVKHISCPLPGKLTYIGPYCQVTENSVSDFRRLCDNLEVVPRRFCHPQASPESKNKDWSRPCSRLAEGSSRAAWASPSSALRLALPRTSPTPPAVAPWYRASGPGLGAPLPWLC